MIIFFFIPETESYVDARIMRASVLFECFPPHSLPVHIQSMHDSILFVFFSIFLQLPVSSITICLSGCYAKDRSSVRS